MKKFRFRLDTLLRVRAASEERARREHAQAARAWHEATDTLRRLQAEAEGGFRAIREELAGACRPERLGSLQRFLACAALRVEAQQRVVEEARLEMESRREALVEASRERKVVENLFEREMARYQESLLLEEQKFMDEMAGSRFVRARSGDLEMGVA